MFRQLAASVVQFLLFELIHQVKDVVESRFPSVSDALPCHRYGQMRFAGPGSSDHDDVGMIHEKVALVELPHLHVIDR